MLCMLHNKTFPANLFDGTLKNLFIKGSTRFRRGKNINLVFSDYRKLLKYETFY